MARAVLPSDQRVPAILGGPPAFPKGLPLVRPSVPNAEAVANDLRRILESRHLTNGPHVRRLEERAAEYLDVRHCVAVASCTAGLMLVIRAAELTGDVIVPSFTFAATAHSVAWNGLRPVFADIDPGTLTLSPQAVRRSVGVRTSAILATHVYGTPCDVEGLAAVALEHGIRLFFDAAHAFGSRRQGKPVGGFGHAEVFSLSPTKVMIAGEGGIIATNDDVLAERCRIGRDYGNPGDYDCIFVGLNARMSEIHAALALRSLEGLDERLKVRNTLASAYRAALAELPGISFPEVPEGSKSTFKDFTILVDPDAFGLDAAELGRALAAEGVETRRYYAPPVHTMRAYRYLNGRNGHLPVTEQISPRVLTLPLWSDMTESHLVSVSDAIDGIYRAARREKFPTFAGEKIRRPQDGRAGFHAYGDGGSEGGRDG
jgi:dTDP-4-amino-4,6-dideoxygalactose transaminase